MSQLASIDVQAIRRRAHERWLERGSPTGSPERDWLEAEQELRAEAARAEACAALPAPVALVPAPVTPAEPAPSPTRRRAPRTFVTRTASAPAARLLVALVPGASEAHRAAASGERRR
jgi:hypothetical protein